jgi:hypothetical protein
MAKQVLCTQDSAMQFIRNVNHSNKMMISENKRLKSKIRKEDVTLGYFKLR